MIEEKTFVDFMIIEIQIFSFGGFYLNKICMMGKLHKNISKYQFSLFGKIWVQHKHALLEKNINDHELCHFFIVLHGHVLSS